MKARLLTFNNRGFPRMSLESVNAGDYKVLDAKPDIVMEQERWFVQQWGGFKKIFSVLHGFVTHRPKLSAVGGLISAHRSSLFTRIVHFSFLGHGSVPYICNFRPYMGEVLKVGNTSKTLTYINVHPTPSAWGSRFPEGSRRKRMARAAWYRYMHRVKAFAKAQLDGGRDYVVIAGDFNASRIHLKELFGSGLSDHKVQILTSSWNYRIDHIILIGKISVEDEGIIKGTPSDHAPFYADVEFL